jgi:hypothetical protein
MSDLIPAEVRLAQYGERTSTWSTATYNDGTEKALHQIALELKAELDRVRKENRNHERSLDEVMRERDYAQNMADKLAAAIAPEDVLGEHSDGNFPWQNALDWAPEKERTTAELLALVEQLTKERNRFRFAWNNARARAATLAEDVEFVERQATATTEGGVQR